MTHGTRTTQLGDRLAGAHIVYVETAPEAPRLILVFEHRGTDDDSGYLIVDVADVHFADGGDPDAWKGRT